MTDETIEGFAVECLICPERQLNNEELRGIAGQGLKVSLPDRIEEGNSRIILWDESANKVSIYNISTGSGNFQKNTLSLEGR